MYTSSLRDQKKNRLVFFQADGQREREGGGSIYNNISFWVGVGVFALLWDKTVDTRQDSKEQEIMQDLFLAKGHIDSSIIKTMYGNDW